MKKSLKIILSGIIILFVTKISIPGKTTITYDKNAIVTINNFTQKLLSQLHDKKNKNIEIFIYYYSSGKEIYTLNKDQSIQRKSGPKEIKAAIKIRKNKKLIKVHFINEKAETEEDLIKILSEKTNQVISTL